LRLYECKGWVKDMIYLDNAATTMRKPQKVIDAVVQAMSSMGNAGRGVNDASLSASRIIYDTRERICRMVGGTNPRQVVFTCNSTESLNMALRGLLNPGDHVITTMLEHNSVLRPLYDLESKGTKLTIIGCRERGTFDIEDMRKAITSETKMIVCTNGSNLTGNYVDLKPIGELAHENGLLFVVDASQTAGVFPIDVEEMKIDVLCFTGHKGMLGPQGTGGMYVREGVTVRSLKAGGTGVQTYSKTQPAQMPTALEAGTLNGHGIAGLHAALEYLEEYGIDNIRKREQELMWRFYEGVKDIENVTIYGDFTTKNRCAIVTLNIGDYDSSEVSDALLTEYSISTRSGGHCAPLMHEALGTVEQGAVRFSFSHYNTDEEVDAAIQAVQDLAREEE
jgi:cysteine desulfurase family protein